MLRRRGYGLRCVQLLLVLVVCAGGSSAQTTSFTYQGKLSDGGGPATGSYDLQFTLWDALSGGTQQPQPSPVTVTKTNVAVSGGNFTVQLDFGASGFPGADRFLQIGVRPTGGGGFTILSPRQSINSAPYAIKSQVSDGLSVGCVNCITSSQIASVNGSAVTGTIPVGSVPAGSANYVQNTTSSQPSSNFNISGNGVVGGSIGIGISSPVYRLHVVQNVANTYGAHIQTSGLATGSSFGLVVSAGTDANDVSFNARNQSGTSMFMVRGDGRVGVGTTNPAALLHVSSSNVAGTSFVLENLVGAASRQVILSNYGSTGGGLYWPGLDSAFTSSLLGPNLFVLRSTGGLAFSGSSAAEHMRISTSGNIGIGTTNPNFKFEVNSTQNNQFAALIRNIGSPIDASYGLLVRGGTSTNDTAFETDDMGGNTLLRVKGNGYTGIGVNNPAYRLHVVESVPFAYAGSISGDLGLRISGAYVALLATAVGTSLEVSSGVGVSVTGGLSTDQLTASSNASIGGDAVFNGRVTFNNLPNGGLPLICYASSSNFFTLCASSRRFKTNINDFSRGLDLIRSLRPVTFDWISEDRHDIGLIAEEVETVEPMLATYLKDGQIQGVRYDLIGVVLINAVKEQQAQIEAQQQQLKRLQEQIKRQEDQARQQRVAQQQQIEALKELVCRGQRRAGACR